MHYAALKPLDIANGPGIRVSLFVSGCRNRCKNCFNPETWSFDYGQEFTYDTMAEIDSLMNSPHISGLSILGGDPFEPENRAEVERLCKFVRYYHPEKSIWMWTGYLYEDLKHLPVMRYIDVLVDGRFEEDLKDLRLKYRGSSNQRVIDVRESLIEDDVIELP